MEKHKGMESHRTGGFVVNMALNLYKPHGDARMMIAPSSKLAALAAALLFLTGCASSVEARLRQ